MGFFYNRFILADIVDNQMKIFRLNWLLKKYTSFAVRFADGLFILILMCGGIAFYLLLLLFGLMFSFWPLGLLFEHFSFLAKSIWGVVIFIVLAALVCGINILLFNCLLGPGKPPVNPVVARG